MSQQYKNPVYPGSCPDPFVLRFNGLYYAYGTEDAGDGRFFPILSSPDLVNWTAHGGALAPLPAPDAREYWAPEVAYDNGVFYMYYAVIAFGTEEHHLRVATATHPLGPWTDRGINLTPDEIFAIDAHPFQDVDGSWYLYYARDWLESPYTGTGIVVDRLSSFLELEGKPARVLRPYADWQLFELQRAEKGGVDWYTVEGPYVVRRRGKYVCFYSGGRWERPNYGVGYLVADQPIGAGGLDDRSWEDPGSAECPVVLRTPPAGIVGPGHNSLAVAPNNVSPYMVYHGWDPDLTARSLRIDRIRWSGLRPTVDGPTTGPEPAPPLPLLHARFADPTTDLAGWKGRGEWDRNDTGARARSEDASIHVPAGSWRHWVLEVALRLSESGGEAGIVLDEPSGAPLRRAPIRCTIHGAGQERFSLAARSTVRSLENPLPVRKLNLETLALPSRFLPGNWHRLLVIRQPHRIEALLDSWPCLVAPDSPSRSAEEVHLFSAAAGAEFAACSLTPHFSDDFLEPPSLNPAALGWDATASQPGRWEIRDGWLHQDDPSPGQCVLTKGDAMNSFEASCQLRLAGAARAGLLLGCSGDGSPTAVLLGRAAKDGVQLRIERSSEGNAEPVHGPYPADPDQGVSLHAEVRGGALSVWVDGARAAQVEVPPTEGCIGLVTEDGAAAFTDVAMTWLPEE